MRSRLNASYRRENTGGRRASRQDGLITVSRDGVGSPISNETYNRRGAARAGYPRKKGIQSGDTVQLAVSALNVMLLKE